MFLLSGCAFLQPPFGVPHGADAQDLENPEQGLKSRRAGVERFYLLNEAAKQAADKGDWPLAMTRAQEALALAPQFLKDWNYGNAIHDGHMVLGRVALARGNKKEAIRRLLLAGATPGSPQLDSFGPNMSLARDLLTAGEKTAVLRYFDLCARFWKMGGPAMKQWRADIRANRTPDFGANLDY